MSLVEMRGASRLWDGVVGLHPFDLHVDRGEVVVVKGRSGSGKSTLLALVAGLCVPDGGTVIVDGAQPLVDMPWAQLAIVPQVLALATELSVRENITDSAPHSDDTHIDALLVLLDLVEIARRTITEISMGQQQRVAVARAIGVTPSLLLADEPTSFQDSAHTSVVVAALRHAAVGGAGVLVATHDPTMIAAADRVLEVVAK